MCWLENTTQLNYLKIPLIPGIMGICSMVPSERTENIFHVNYHMLLWFYEGLAWLFLPCVPFHSGMNMEEVLDLVFPLIGCSLYFFLDCPGVQYMTSNSVIVQKLLFLTMRSMIHFLRSLTCILMYWRKFSGPSPNDRGCSQVDRGQEDIHGK